MNGPRFASEGLVQILIINFVPKCLGSGMVCFEFAEIWLQVIERPAFVSEL
jgi:hypothetical protein